MNFEIGLLGLVFLISRPKLSQLYQGLIISSYLTLMVRTEQDNTLKDVSIVSDR